MVVVIIGILAAIAIPNYIGQQDKAKDAAAMAQLRMAATSQQLYYVDQNAYAGNATDLEVYGFRQGWPTPVPTVCRPLVAEARSGSLRTRAGLYQAHARRSPAVGVERSLRTGSGLAPIQNGTSEGKWNSPAIFANIR
jgi:Tfp pilus assembly protein PilE